DQWLIELQRRRQLVVDTLHLPPPAGAFYCFIDIRRFGLDSITFCQRLLQEYHVALVPGIYFGREGFVRLSFASSQKKIQTALERLAAFYAILVQ
ncbi:MAG: aminotransferase class I and II, partial [uncultured bacterium]